MPNCRPDIDLTGLSDCHDSSPAVRSPAQHPLRDTLHNELHARPSLYFDGDKDVWHVAIVNEGEAPRVPPECLALEDVYATGNGRHGIARLGDGQVKWELHTEFLTLTHVARPQNAERRPPREFEALAAAAEGKVLSSVCVVVRNETGQHRHARPGGEYVASHVGGRHAEVHSNFRLTKSGYVEFLLFNSQLNAYRTGRMVRRLLEIEDYRMMAMLSVPLAEETLARLAAFENRLNALVAHLQRGTGVDKAQLSDVMRLSSEVLDATAASRRRFGASKAYAEIVTSRLGELREERVEQRQRVGTFIDRRFQPAVRTFVAAERRLNDLLEGVGLAGQLLRTAVQVQLEDQNAALLASVERRARAQLQIQQAVEGLSVIAVSYYLLGLAKYALDSLTGIGLDPHVAKAAMVLSIPIAVFAVWRTVKRIRESIATPAAEA